MEWDWERGWGGGWWRGRLRGKEDGSFRVIWGTRNLMLKLNLDCSC